MSHKVRNIPSDMCPAKIQIRLSVRTVSLEYLLSAFEIAKDAKFLLVDKKDSDQPAWMFRIVFGTELTISEFVSDSVKNPVLKRTCKAAYIVGHTAIVS